MCVKCAVLQITWQPHCSRPAWTVNTEAVAKKAQQQLHFLLTYAITVWHFSCTEAEKKGLQGVVRSAEKIISWPLASLLDIYKSSCLSRAKNIVKDTFHTGYHPSLTCCPLASSKGDFARGLTSFSRTLLRRLNGSLGSFVIVVGKTSLMMRQHLKKRQ